MHTVKVNDENFLNLIKRSSTCFEWKNHKKKCTLISVLCCRINYMGENICKQSTLNAP